MIIRFYYSGVKKTVVFDCNKKKKKVFTFLHVLRTVPIGIEKINKICCICIVYCILLFINSVNIVYIETYGHK